MDEKEYIKREAVIEMANELYVRHLTLQSHEIGSAILDFNQFIRKVPAADVVKVRHGEWKCNRGQAYGEPLFYCSLCVDGGSNNGHDNYCPNCGAKMDGKDDSE